MVNCIRDYLKVNGPMWREFAACVMALKRVEPALNIFPVKDTEESLNVVQSRITVYRNMFNEELKFYQPRGKSYIATADIGAGCFLISTKGAEILRLRPT